MPVEDYYPNGKRGSGCTRKAARWKTRKPWRRTKAPRQSSMIEDHVAEQLAEAKETQEITKLELAARMKTSHRQLDRLFEPSIPSVTLDTFRRPANAVGRSLRIESV
jgi:ribosome-binding protein aMBF1 (putative translation factor)